MIEAYEVGVSLVMSDSILESLSTVTSRFIELQSLIDASNEALKRMDSLTKAATSSANSLAAAMGKIASAAGRGATNTAGMNAAASGGGYGSNAGVYSGGGSNERSPRQRSGKVSTPYGSLTYEPAPMPINPENLPATIPGQPYYSGDNGQPNFKRVLYVPDWTGGNPDYKPPMPINPENLPATIPGTQPYGRDSWPGYKIPGYGTGGTPIGPDSEPSDYTPNFTMTSGGDEDAKTAAPKKTSRPRYSSGGGSDIFAEGTGAYFGYSLLKTTFGDAGQIDAVKANMLASGFTPAQVAAAYAEADKLRQQVPGTSNLENLKEILFLKARFGSVQEAMNSLPDILKQGVVVTAASNGGIDYNQWLSSLNDNLEAMARAGEISGKLVNPKTHKIDPVRLATFTKNMADLALASGGVITPQDLLALSQNAGPGVVSQLSNPELFGGIAPIILSMGGARAGTALNALAMQFKGGKMSQYNARALHDIGLLPDYMFGKDDKILKKYRYGIGMAEIPAGALPGAELYNTSPGAWLMKVLLPHLIAHGYTTVAEQQNYMYKMLSRTTGIRGMQDLITNLPQIEMYYAEQQAQQKQDNYQTIVANNPLLQAESLNAAVSAFMTTSGQTWMPQAIEMINGMTDFMNAAGKLAAANPKTTSWALNGVGIVSGLAAFGFAIGILSYALKPIVFIVKTLRVAWTAMDWIGTKVLAPLDSIITRSAAQIFKFFDATMSFATDLAAGEGVAVAAVTAFGEVIAAIGAVAGAAYALNTALDWVDKKLAGLLGIQYPSSLPEPAFVTEGENWARKHLDNVFGINYTPDVVYSPWTGPNNWAGAYSPQSLPVNGSLAPSAATPPKPQPTQQSGPIPVHVTNPRDIHNGVAQAFTNQLLGIQYGPTGHDSSFGIPLPSGH